MGFKLFIHNTYLMPVAKVDADIGVNTSMVWCMITVTIWETFDIVGTEEVLPRYDGPNVAV